MKIEIDIDIESIVQEALKKKQYFHTEDATPVPIETTTTNSRTFSACNLDGWSVRTRQFFFHFLNVIFEYISISTLLWYPVFSLNSFCS